MSAAVTSQLTAANPFVGLRPFGIDDADYFFGRDDETAEIIASLRQSRLLAIVGASGSGKSSLIYAGVLPSLPAHLWQVAVMNPGATPMENLRQALASALELPAPVVAANLAAGSLGVANAVAASSINPAKRILLFVDQFEELFTIDQPREPVRAFVQLLLRAVQSDDSRLLVLLTMRSEFLGSCSDFPGLPGAISRGLYLVDRPTRPQFRDAIIEPLRENGVDITDRLVDEILNDLQDDEDQLPLLQHCLRRMWAVHTKPLPPAVFDLEHYRDKRVGSLRSALSTHAEEAYLSLGAEESMAAQWLFRQITQVTRSGRLVRRPQPWSLLSNHPKVADAARKFRDPDLCFLRPVLPAALYPDTLIDITHESLMRQWERLRSWATDEARLRNIHADLHEDAQRWAANNRDTAYLTYRGAWLRDVLRTRQGWTYPTEPIADEFLQAAQIQEQHDRDQRTAELLATAAARRPDNSVYLIHAPEDLPRVQPLVVELRAMDFHVRTSADVDFEEARYVLKNADLVVICRSSNWEHSNRPEAEAKRTTGSLKSTVEVQLDGQSAGFKLINSGYRDLPDDWSPFQRRLIRMAMELYGQMNLFHDYGGYVSLAGLQWSSIPEKLPKAMEAAHHNLLAWRRFKKKFFRISAVASLVLSIAVAMFLTRNIQLKHEREQAQQIATSLLGQYGWPGDQAAAAKWDDPIVQNSIRAARILDELPARADQAAVSIHYSPQAADQRRGVDALSRYWERTGYKVTFENPSSSGETNLLRYTPRVQPSDVGRIALSLLRAGVGLRWIGESGPSAPAQEQLIVTVDHSAAANSQPLISPEEIARRFLSR